MLGDPDGDKRVSALGSLLGRDPAAPAVKRIRLGVSECCRGVAVLPTEVSDLIGCCAAAGVQLFIVSAWRNDAETLGLLAT